MRVIVKFLFIMTQKTKNHIERVIGLNQTQQMLRKKWYQFLLFKICLLFSLHPVLEPTTIQMVVDLWDLTLFKRSPQANYNGHLVLIREQTSVILLQFWITSVPGSKDSSCQLSFLVNYMHHFILLLKIVTYIVQRVPQNSKYAAS